MSIGKNIQYLRKQKGFTQEQLAEVMAVNIKTIKGFHMAKYTMIIRNPEEDVNRYMDEWARQSGLLSIDPNARKIDWEFPFVSSELQSRFGLRGHTCAYILPDGFDITNSEVFCNCPQVEYARQEDADYAVITVYDPFIERILKAHERILTYLQIKGLHVKVSDDALSSFEHIYSKDCQICMDLYIHIDNTPTNLLSYTDCSRNV